MSRADEWCSLSTAPVYPHRHLSTDGARLSRREALSLARHVHPGPDGEFRLRNLPRLGAVVALPRKPRPDQAGTAVPALWLEDNLHRKNRPFRSFPGRVGTRENPELPEEFYVETSRGFDRYILGPEGLRDCGRTDAPDDMDGASTSVRLGKPESRRNIQLRRERELSGRFRIADGFALGCAVLALGFRMFGPAGTEGTTLPSTDPSTSSGTAEQLTSDAVAPMEEIAETFPDLSLTSISREGKQLYLEGEIPGRVSPAELMSRLKPLLPRFKVQVEHGPAGSIIHMEGEEW
jgi:hypothetical protein